MAPLLQHVINWLVMLDERHNFALRRGLGVMLIAGFIAALCLMLYFWFQVMQPYPE